ncbi:spore germination protein GerPE [Niallia sp. NCCP-28]|uniref:spore germination protein GerPE n=1 Tax=Niallia sp. NCCP-28 TaxID=2934712 RepID=UPI00208D792E|nr:spore germination protein GerPE [Niallia sp. NCCP-28]GKU81724.1 putative spore germination protein GerPE [Niallia sp. NCCP-28]
MLQRTSVVNKAKAVVLSFSSIFEIGDANYFQAMSRALAVQRQKKIFYGIEGSFNDYPIFSEPLHLPPIEEEITCHFENLKPIIKVNNINITGVSAASLLQIGNCRHLYAEARIKHIRQLDAPKATSLENNLIQLEAPNEISFNEPNVIPENRQ